MRKNFGAKAILYPMPVLIIGTYDENGKPNAMNAAWGGISEETQISICVDDRHKTAKKSYQTMYFLMIALEIAAIFGLLKFFGII